MAVKLEHSEAKSFLLEYVLGDKLSARQLVLALTYLKDKHTVDKADFEHKCGVGAYLKLHWVLWCVLWPFAFLCFQVDSYDCFRSGCTHRRDCCDVEGDLELSRSRV